MATMKALILLCLVCAVFAEDVELSNSQKLIVKKFTEHCVKRTGATDALVEEFKKGNIVEDESLNKFVFCFFKKAGLVDSKGIISVELTLARLPPGADYGSAEKALNACKNETGKDPAELTARTLRCYYSKSSQRISFAF